MNVSCDLDKENWSGINRNLNGCPAKFSKRRNFPDSLQEVDHCQAETHTLRLPTHSHQHLIQFLNGSYMVQAVLQKKAQGCGRACRKRSGSLQAPLVSTVRKILSSNVSQITLVRVSIDTTSIFLHQVSTNTHFTSISSTSQLDESFKTKQNKMILG